MKIKVTQKHINSGARNNCWSCPIAIAMADAGFEHPSVSDKHLSYYPFNQSPIRFHTPEICRLFISDFDNHRPVKPFEFDLEISRQ